MTPQDVFNTVYLGLRSQGFLKSITRLRGSGYGCKLRGDLGFKCAMGYLIPDDRYLPSYESMCAGEPEMKEFLTDLGYGEHLELITALQEAHDISVGGDNLEMKLVGVAQKFGLEIPVQVPYKTI